jgi:primosomal protein N' (replication factor Y)
MTGSARGIRRPGGTSGTPAGPVARVIVDVPARETNREFDYWLPPELVAITEVGSRVEVPFGRRVLQGLVTEIRETTDVPSDKLKPVSDVLDLVPPLTPELIRLGKWMGETWVCPDTIALQAMLPGALKAKYERLLEVSPDGEERTEEETDRAIVAWVKARKHVPVRTLLEKFPGEADRVKRLVKRGVLAERQTVRDRVKPMKRLFVYPPRDPSAIDAWVAGLPASAKRQKAVLAHLREHPEPVALAELTKRLGVDSGAVKALADKGYVAIREREVLRDPYGGRTFAPLPVPELTGEQAAACAEIGRCLESGIHARYLLHGVTGSGKTEVYLQTISRCLDLGREAIVLVPEISLTPQMVDRFKGRFGDRVAVLHSRLSQGERYDEWRKIHRGEVSVAVGARSAVFAPFTRLGLIIIDEEHESSYKQEESPKYHARDVAAWRAAHHGAVLVLGSATPSLESYRLARLSADGSNRRTNDGRADAPAGATGVSEPETAESAGHTGGTNAPAGGPGRTEPGGSEGQSRSHGLTIGLEPLRLIRMPHRVGGRPLPPVHLVDMRKELEEGNRSMFSRMLAAGIRDRLMRNEQMVLLLNRRGYATFVLCRSCGYSAVCPHCDVSLTFHQKTGMLRCHYCGYAERNPESCPSCGSPHIRHFGTGTQRVEEELIKTFPGIRVIRMDMDTTGEKGAHEKWLNQFRERKADVLLGTQMVAKGLDFPAVTLVGVLAADAILHLPDFRAVEKTFQLVTQVAGRAGRHELPGEVIVQTYNPDHYAMQAAAAHDYEGFAGMELKLRRDRGYPPFARLALITLSHPSQPVLVKTGEQLARAVRARWLKEAGQRGLDASLLDVLGPAASPIPRLKDRYRMQCVVKYRHDLPAPAIIRAALDSLQDALAADAVGEHVQISVDIDPQNMM